MGNNLKVLAGERKNGLITLSVDEVSVYYQVKHEG